MSEDFRNEDAQNREEERSRNEDLTGQVNVNRKKNNEKFKFNKKRDMETAQEYTPQRDTVRRVKPELDSQENDF